MYFIENCRNLLKKTKYFTSWRY